MLLELLAVRDPGVGVLEPDLVISQGREARWALELGKEPLPD